MIGHAGTRHHRSTLGENQRPQSLPALDSDDVRGSSGGVEPDGSVRHNTGTTCTMKGALTL
jgi:hypothetical protein